eukprot:2886497-Pleurochrysis_carterae.AAC.1
MGMASERRREQPRPSVKHMARGVRPNLMSTQTDKGEASESRRRDRQIKQCGIEGMNASHRQERDAMGMGSCSRTHLVALYQRRKRGWRRSIAPGGRRKAKELVQLKGGGVGKRLEGSANAQKPGMRRKIACRTWTAAKKCSQKTGRKGGKDVDRA